MKMATKEIPLRRKTTTEKVLTTMLIDKKLKDRGQRYNINISALCNQALEVAVSRLKEAD